MSASSRTRTSLMPARSLDRIDDRVVRDHAAHVVAIGDEQLRLRQKGRHHAEQDRAGDDADVPAPVGIHAPHPRRHHQPHRPRSVACSR